MDNAILAMCALVTIILGVGAIWWCIKQCED